MSEDLAQIADERLMARLAAGELEALGELYRRHGPLVRSAITRYAPEISAAELDELVQEVFLTVSDTAARYQEQQRCKAWLYGIAVRKARSWQRTTWLRRRLLKGQRGEPVALARPSGGSPERAVALRELVERTLSRLNPGQRQVLLLHAVEGFTGEEIAGILGVRPETVWTRLHRARKAVLDSEETRAALAALVEGDE
jgi:RNA polymerase sigma-70 factor (ECF subfamily)